MLFGPARSEHEGGSVRRSLGTISGLAAIVVASLLIVSLPGGQATAAAKGRPIHLFFLNYNGSATGPNYPETGQAVTAMTDYINNQLGGVHGRPIDVQFCSIDGSVAAATTCADQAVSVKPDVVAWAPTPVDTNIVSITNAAKIPDFTFLWYTPSLTGKLAFDPNNFLDNGYASVLENEKALGGTSVAFIIINVPGAIAGVTTIDPLAKKLGITVYQDLVPLTAADITPQFEAAMAQKPSAMVVIGGPNVCLAAMQAREALDYTGRFYQISACDVPSVFAAAGAQANQTYIANVDTYALNTSSPDSKIYLKAMAKYEPSVSRSTALDLDATLSAAQTMDLYNVLMTAKNANDINSKTIPSIVRSAKNVHYFLGAPNTTFTCNHPYASAPAACGAFEWLAKYDNGGYKYIRMYTTPK
jgi:branched-chain amino acid transport system substrate-binding protein